VIKMKNIVITKRTYFFRKVMAFVFLCVFVVLVFYTYLNWYRFSSLEKLLFTFLDLIFSSMSLKDIKSIFLSYDKYLEEININD
jgi:hypothetical protein